MREERVMTKPGRTAAGIRVVACAAILLAGLGAVAGLAACGGSGAPSAGAPSAGATSSGDAPSTAPSSGSPVSVVGRTTAQGARLPSDAVIAVLEGRIAAMNRGDGVAAAAFYVEDGVLEETDMNPDLVTRGRENLAVRFADLYGMGLRLAPAGAPIAYDRYVAEPTRFHRGNPPGRGAGMLVFEVDAQNHLAYQWMIGWAGGPEKTFAIRESPSVDQPSLPPRDIRKILDARMAAVNQGDSQRAAAFYAKRGVLEETDQDPDLMTRGRENIAVRLEDLYDMGLRLAPAGAPITYDRYVAEPVRFLNEDGPGTGAGMLVFEFDPARKIAHHWVIGWTD
jgi:hypothetical protein